VSPELSDWATPRIAQINKLLLSRFDNAWPESFGKMCKYPLQTGGKRMRPLWSIAAWEAIRGDSFLPALNSAASIELIHTYSLVHDDLPCMDDDNERRGSPTVHIAFGEAPALLVGDALLTEAFKLAAEPSKIEAATRANVVAEIAEAAGFMGMIGGQAADIGLAGKVEDVETLKRLHEGKTGALIRISTRVGAICAEATSQELAAITEYGQCIGLAFQLADDVLDAEEDAGDGGPPSYATLLGVEECQRQASTLRDQAIAALTPFGARGAILEKLARYTVDRDI
jgi:geranylgeranyl pyrophosphate synthase